MSGVSNISPKKGTGVLSEDAITANSPVKANLENNNQTENKTEENKTEQGSISKELVVEKKEEPEKKEESSLMSIVKAVIPESLVNVAESLTKSFDFISSFKIPDLSKVAVEEVKLDPETSDIKGYILENKEKFTKLTENILALQPTNKNAKKLLDFLNSPSPDKFPNVNGKHFLRNLLFDTFDNANKIIENNSKNKKTDVLENTSEANDLNNLKGSMEEIFKNTNFSYIEERYKPTSFLGLVSHSVSQNFFKVLGKNSGDENKEVKNTINENKDLINALIKMNSNNGTKNNETIQALNKFINTDSIAAPEAKKDDWKLGKGLVDLISKSKDLAKLAPNSEDSKKILSLIGDLETKNQKVLTAVEKRTNAYKKLDALIPEFDKNILDIKSKAREIAKKDPEFANFLLKMVGLAEKFKDDPLLFSIYSQYMKNIGNVLRDPDLLGSNLESIEERLHTYQQKFDATITKIIGIKNSTRTDEEKKNEILGVIDTNQDILNTDIGEKKDGVSSSGTKVTDILRDILIYDDFYSKADEPAPEKELEVAPQTRVNTESFKPANNGKVLKISGNPGKLGISLTTPPATSSNDNAESSEGGGKTIVGATRGRWKKVTAEVNTDLEIQLYHIPPKTPIGVTMPTKSGRTKKEEEVNEPVLGPVQTIKNPMADITKFVLSIKANPTGPNDRALKELVQLTKEVGLDETFNDLSSTVEQIRSAFREVGIANHEVYDANLEFNNTLDQTLNSLKPIVRDNAIEESEARIDDSYKDIVDAAIREAENSEFMLNANEFQVDNNLMNGVQLLEKFREIIVELDTGLRAIHNKVSSNVKLDTDYMKEARELRKRKEKAEKLLKMIERDFKESKEVKSQQLSNLAKQAILKNDLKLINIFVQEMNMNRVAIGMEY
ncbi:MAG: hypothetical protein U0457_02250 [Candidatus Sericytochromatia bacterium]